MKLIPLIYQRISFLTAIGISLAIFSTISRFIVLPDFLSTVLSLVWICYFPLLVGKTLFNLSYKIRTFFAELTSQSTVYHIFQWFAGFILLVLLMYGLLVSKSGTLYGISTALLIVFILIDILYNSRFRLPYNTQVATRSLVTVIIISTIGIVYASYVRSFSPFPLSPGTDIFTHVYVVKSILANSIDSPLLYLPVFDIFIALASSAFATNIINIFWVGPIILFTLFSIGCYAFSYRITHNIAISIFTCIVALSITELGLVPNLATFYPSSFVMSIFPLLLYVSDLLINKKQLRPITLAALSVLFIGLILIHIQLGILATAMILVYVSLPKALKRSTMTLYSTRILHLSVVTIVLAIYLGAHSNLLVIAHLVDVKYMYDTETKIKLIDWFYTKWIFLVAITGLILLAFTKSTRAVTVGLLASILLFLYFQRIDTTHRILVLVRPLLAFSAASMIIYPMIWLSQFMAMKNRKIDIYHDSSKKRTLAHVSSKASERFTKGFFGFKILSNSKYTIIYFILAIIIIFPILTTPYDTYISPYLADSSSFADFSHAELKAASMIENNTSQHSLLYSDPFTVIEMRGLAFRKNIEGIGWNKTVQDMVKSVFVQQNSSEAYKRIVSYAGSDVVVVITPRTSQWIANKPIKNFGTVTEFELFGGLDKFFDRKYFVPIYSDNNIFVFGLKNR